MGGRVLGAEGDFDYAVWAKNLRQKLIDHERAYLVWDACERDMPDAQHLRDYLLSDVEPIDMVRLEAVKAFAAVMLALSKLPAFARDIGGSGTIPLRHLAAAVAGLHNGRRHPLIETRKIETRKAATQGEDFRRGQLQALACFGVELIEKLGISNIAAREKVAERLGNVGVTGRHAKHGRAQPLSAATLYKWAVDIKSEPDTARRKSYLAELRQVQPNVQFAQNEVDILLDLIASNATSI